MLPTPRQQGSNGHQAHKNLPEVFRPAEERLVAKQDAQASAGLAGMGVHSRCVCGAYTQYSVCCST